MDNDKKNLVIHILDQKLTRNPMVQLAFWLDYVLTVKILDLFQDIWKSLFTTSRNKAHFWPWRRGPIEKRVAPSDSSSIFGPECVLPKFFYHYPNGFYSGSSTSASSSRNSAWPSEAGCAITWTTQSIVYRKIWDFGALLLETSYIITLCHFST